MKQVNKSQVRLHQEEPSADFRNEPAPSQGRDKQIRNRATGLLILLVLAGAYWVYGWAGKITLIDVSTQPVNWTSQVIYAKLLVLSAVFTIIGYGLLLSYYKNMSASAFLISLFVVSFTLIISPFISKFWFNVFLSDFKGNTFSAVTTPDRFLKYSFGGMDVFLDFYNLKVGMVNSISQLVMLLGVFGRLNTIQIVLNTLIYNITWNLCHFLCANLQLQGPDSRIFDDYQISNVYLFASCYSLILLLILKSPRISMKADIQSSVLALLGTFFVFLSFCATSTQFPLKFTPGQSEYARSYIWQEGFLNIFFALVGSVIFSCVGSIVLGGFSEGSKALEGKIGLRECVFGTITGGIIYGPVAGTAVNIGAAIASGLFSGLLSSIIYRFVVKKINSSELRDSYGVTNTLSVSFLATFCISPSILIAYFNRDWILPTLEVSNFDKVGLPLINASIAGWVIAYVGISMGIGLVSGAAAGGILFFFKSVSRGHDQDFFNMQYGLTSSNVQALQEDYLQSTNFQRVMRLLKSKNLVSSSAASMVETTEIKKEGQQFKSTYISNLDVQIHDKVDDVVLEQYRKQLRAIVPNANVVRAEGGLLTSGQPQEASQRNRVKKFRAIYGQIKSRQLEDSLSSSSLVNLKAETTQRSVAGNEERRVAIRSTFERLDDGVALLNAYDKSCEDMSLQVDIQA